LTQHVRMVSTHTHLSTWVTRDQKRHFTVLADEHGLSESAYLKRLVERTIDASGDRSPEIPKDIGDLTGSGRLSLRFRPEDLSLLREHAQARQMPTSTYAVWLVRAHLRHITPMPPGELAAFKRAIAEVGAIGRNVNQLVRAINRGEATFQVTKADLMAWFRALTGLRDYMKALVVANQESWRVGYEKAGR